MPALVRPDPRYHRSAVAAAGIDPALLTCDEDHLASRRIIEGAGGALENQVGRKRRYWVPTHPIEVPDTLVVAARPGV